MKIVAISDSHDQHRQIEIPPCDILIVAGDFTCHRDPILENYEDFGEWLKGLPIKHEIVVAGNHDTLFDRIYDRDGVFDGKDFFDHFGATYLEDSCIEIEGLNIYGSPWTPEFNGWAFMKPDAELKEYWDKIPDDTDVLVTHGGPYGILDQNLEGQYCGSSSLLGRIHKLRNLKYHIFGHIHEAKGQHHSKELPATFINASQCDRLNNLVNKPVIIEI